MAGTKWKPLKLVDSDFILLGENASIAGVSPETPKIIFLYLNSPLVDGIGHTRKYDGYFINYKIESTR